MTSVRQLNLSDETWEWLAGEAMRHGYTYRGRPSRSGYVDALASELVATEVQEEGASDTVESVPVVSPPVSIMPLDEALRVVKESPRGVKHFCTDLEWFYELITGAQS